MPSLREWLARVFCCWAPLVRCCRCWRCCTCCWCCECCQCCECCCGKTTEKDPLVSTYAQLRELNFWLIQVCLENQSFNSCVALVRPVECQCTCIQSRSWLIPKETLSVTEVCSWDSEDGIHLAALPRGTNWLVLLRSWTDFWQHEGMCSL